MVIGELVHNPVDQLRQEFAFDCPTGFADGRQHGPSPLLRTVLMERVHQQTGRCADEIHVAGPNRATTSFTLVGRSRDFTLSTPAQRETTLRNRKGGPAGVAGSHLIYGNLCQPPTVG
jgi:hypothetical protein